MARAGFRKQGIVLEKAGEGALCRLQASPVMLRQQGQPVQEGRSQRGAQRAPGASIHSCHKAGECREEGSSDFVVSD